MCRALRYANLVGYGQSQAGDVFALPFGMAAPGGINVYIGTGDPVTGFTLGKIFNWGATVLNVPFGTGHLNNYYQHSILSQQ